MITFDECKKQVLLSVMRLGKPVKDEHLNRTVVQSIGVTITIPGPVIDELDVETLLEKYDEDKQRMQSTYYNAVAKALLDASSRQLVVLNVDDYEKVQQCFQLMQFCLDDSEFTVLVYQRSADLAKLKDDWIFFSKTVKQFQHEVGIKIKQIIVNYGNIHVQIHS